MVAFFSKKVTVSNLYYIKSSTYILAARVMRTNPQYKTQVIFQLKLSLPNTHIQLHRTIYPDKHLRDCTARSAFLLSSAPQVSCIPLLSMPFSNLLELQLSVSPMCPTLQAISSNLSFVSRSGCPLKALLRVLVS